MPAWLPDRGAVFCAVGMVGALARFAHSDDGVSIDMLMTPEPE
jgi:hypothetical protein